jgi:hypothetical protein
LTLKGAAGQDCGVQMTDAYTSVVTVSIPIFVLAAGAEARAVRERLKRPDEEWERDFAAYRAEHELSTSGRPAEVIGFMRGAPLVSRLYVVERLLAIGAALVWLAVFVLLAVAEVLSLVWLREEFKAKLKDDKGVRGFFKLAFTEFEGAVERAAEPSSAATAQPSPAATQPSPAASPAGPAPDPPPAGERPGS